MHCVMHQSKSNRSKTRYLHTAITQFVQKISEMFQRQKIANTVLLDNLRTHGRIHLSAVGIFQQFTQEILYIVHSLYSVILLCQLRFVIHFAFKFAFVSVMFVTSQQKLTFT